MNNPERFFAVLGHPVRLRCLLLLQREIELCVCEVTYGLDMAQPAVSRHLAHLREAGWVEDHRQGLWVYYRINTRLPAWAQTVLATTAEGIGGAAPFADDRRRLKRMPNRPGPRGCN